MATNNLGFQDFFSTTLNGAISASDTVITLNAVPTPSEGYLVIEPDSSTNREIIYYTSKGASTVTCPSVAAGRGVGGTTAQSHSSGVTVNMNNVAELWTALQDNSANTGMHQYFDESFNDFVQSGIVISQATGLIASVTSGVVYINGRRLTTAAFSKTFTASKETYVDLIETDGSNLATVSYTELASGATGSTPAANGLHVGRVDSTATAIATVIQSGADILGNPYKQSVPSPFSVDTNGGWRSYTPVFANTTLGNGSVSGRYTQIGKTVHFRAIFVLGSTSAMGTSPTVTIPVTSANATANTPLVGGLTVCLDSGTASYPGVAMWSSTTTVSGIVGGAGATYVTNNGITATAPMTWATNDHLFICGTYEAA